MIQLAGLALSALFAMEPPQWNPDSGPDRDRDTRGTIRSLSGGPLSHSEASARASARHDENEAHFAPSKRKRKRPTNESSMSTRDEMSCQMPVGASSPAPAERSCAECRRLKLRCSRTWPCSSCVKRNCAALCPDGIMKKDPIDQASLLHYSDLLIGYVSQLERAINASGGVAPDRPAAVPTSVADFVEKCTGSLESASQIISQARGSLARAVLKDEHAGLDAQDARTGTTPSCSLLNSDKSEHSHWMTSAASDPNIGRQEFRRDNPRPSSSGTSTPHDSRLTPQNVSRTRSSQSPERQGHEDGARHQGFGLLAISESGSSKYVGPSAGSEWLTPREGQGWSSRHSTARTSSYRRVSFSGAIPSSSSSSSTRRHKAPRDAASQQSYGMPLLMGPDLSPLTSHEKVQVLEKLCGRLPPKREALGMVQWYFRHSYWQFRLVERRKVHTILDAVYSSMACPDGQSPVSEIARLYGGSMPMESRGSRSSFRAVKGEELALLFMVFAIGTWFDLTQDLSAAATTAIKWFEAAQTAFATTSPLSSNSVLGVQVLHLTAIHVLQTQQVNGADIAWPLLGMASRMTQTSGMHIDGEAWNLDPEQLNERRRQFWEVYCHDTFQAVCFGRPGNLSAHEYSCKFPTEEDSDSLDYGDGESLQARDESLIRNPPGTAGYSTLLYRLSRIVRRILSEAFSVRAPRYDVVLAFDIELRKFDDQIPYFIRCRPSCAMPSIVPLATVNATKTRVSSTPTIPGLDALGGRRPSPAIRLDRVRLTLESHDLASCVVQLQMFLHRRPFAEAILLDPVTPSKTAYGYSFLAALDGAFQMIAITKSLFRMYPKLIVRMWSFSYHTYSAAVLCAFCCLHAPLSEWTHRAYEEVKKACKLLEDAKIGPRSEHGLQTLLRLKERAEEAMQEAAADRRKKGGLGRKRQTTNATRHTARGQGTLGARQPLEDSQIHTSEDHEAARAMMGISTRLQRCSEGPCTRDHSPDSDEEVMPEASSTSGSYAVPSLTQQDLISSTPGNSHSRHTLPPNDTLLPSTGAPPAAAAAHLGQIGGPLPYSGANQFAQSTPWASHPSFLDGAIGQDAVDPLSRSRHELQSDLERLLSMEDIWSSLDPSSTTGSWCGLPSAPTAGGFNEAGPDAAMGGFLPHFHEAAHLPTPAPMAFPSDRAPHPDASASGPPEWDGSTISSRSEKRH